MTISPGELQIMQQNVKMGSRKPLERDIEKACSDILALDGWRSLKTDPMSDRKRGKGFGELGMADRLYIRYLGCPHDDTELQNRLNRTRVELAWIEWKREGGQAAPHQVAWHMKERSLGALTLIAGQDFPATIDGFCEWYRNSGLARKLKLQR